ncbi:MAG: flagellin [Planctomycetaceae bacterium]|nr:flagellin [Planctomycetaceae bacterium]
MDPITKEITIYVKFGATTASDIEQLIENDVRTRNYFSVNQLGDGTGLINLDDNTLLTTGGAIPPGNLNGAKLIQGADASDYFLIFKSQEYGSDKFVDVRAYAPTGGTTSFTVQDSKGKTVEKTYGQDVLALVNGVKAVGRGLNASLNTSILSLDFTLSEDSGTDPNYSSTFTINGGGATYQIGPDVVSNQQITLGIQSVNTAQLGGASGKLYQLRSGQDASLTNDTNKAFRIVQESILSITQVRGRLGTIQKATFDTNINVLNDTLQALTEAESQIRDADFAEETANLTRAQILVQAGINSLGIANQLPQYVLSLLGR